MKIMNLKNKEIKKSKKSKLKVNPKKAFSKLQSFKAKVNILVILCVIISVSVTLFNLISVTKSLMIDSALGKMLNIATSYGKIVENTEDGAALTAEEYTAVLQDAKVDDVGSSYCFMINKSGIIIYHDDPAKIGKPNSIPVVTQLIGNINKGIIPDNLCTEYSEDGQTKYASYYITASRSVLIICADGDELMQPVSNLILRSILIAALIIIVAMAVTNLVVRRISKPLERVTSIIGDASKLKFTSSASLDKLCKRRDETGQISRAVQEMCNSLRDVVNQIDQASLRIEFNMDKLEASSNQIHEMCSANSSTTLQMAAGMEETTSITNTLNVHMATMQSEAEDINRQAMTGHHLSQEVTERANALQTVTAQAIHRTTDMYHQIKDKSQLAISGVKSVSRINELTDAIKDISDQTNLLSLNASIEAARAGNAGRGFAVVASEISNLAHRSLETVGDINNIIGDINNAVSNIAESLEHTSVFLEKTVLADYDQFSQIGEQYLQDAGVFQESMTTISTETGHLTLSIQEVAAGLDGIRTTISESTIGINDIADKTADVVQKAGDNHELSGNTVANVKVLKGIVDMFEL